MSLSHWYFLWKRYLPMMWFYRSQPTRYTSVLLKIKTFNNILWVHLIKVHGRLAVVRINRSGCLPSISDIMKSIIHVGLDWLQKWKRLKKTLFSLYLQKEYSYLQWTAYHHRCNDSQCTVNCNIYSMLKIIVHLLIPYPQMSLIDLKRMWDYQYSIFKNGQQLLCLILQIEDILHIVVYIYIT